MHTKEEAVNEMDEETSGEGELGDITSLGGSLRVGGMVGQWFGHGGCDGHYET